MINEYTFPTVSYRATCENVVDGDTVDLFVDMGFHAFRRERFRLYGIDTPELRSKDPVERAAARDAKEEMYLLLSPDFGPEWPLRIETLRDPDSFGRYLVKIYMWEGDASGGKEFCVNDRLVETGHAVYKTYR